MSCSFNGCDRPVFVKATSIGPLCNGHYAQFKKGNTLTTLRKYTKREPVDAKHTCTVPGCGRPSNSTYGLCQSHQKQQKLGVNRDIRKYEFQKDTKCIVDGCDNPAKSKGLCSNHYRYNWGKCKMSGCSRKMYNKASGLCAAHYSKTIPVAISESEDHDDNP